MDEPSENASAPRRYKWPWFVLAAVVLAIVLAMIWMTLKVRSIREQRDPMRYQQNLNDSVPSRAAHWTTLRRTS